MKSLPGVTFLFAKPYSPERDPPVYKRLWLAALPNRHISQDPGRNIGQFYKVAGIPGIYVYNSKGRLVKEFNTNVTSKNLLEALKK